MVYLYGTKPGVDAKLVATFDSLPQLQSYVHWATLKKNPNGTYKFEQGSVLVGYTGYRHSDKPLTADDETEVTHSPTPSML
jgi:hypothetical protein